MKTEVKNTERIVNPIEVRVTLRQEQYTGVMNKWICTIRGEKREVTMQEVIWYCTDLQDAVHSFRTDEIESFSIIGNMSLDRKYRNDYIKTPDNRPR